MNDRWIVVTSVPTSELQDQLNAIDIAYNVSQIRQGSDGLWVIVAAKP